MKKYILFLVLLSSVTYLDAQSLLRRAEIAYQERNYRYAADAYEKYYAKNGEADPTTSIPLANSYYHLGDYPNAKKYYDKTNERAMSALEYLNYGEMLRKQGLYDEAKAMYVKAKKSRKKNVSASRINLAIKACEWAEKNKNTSSSGNVNLSSSGLITGGQSFGLQFYEGDLVYSSSVGRSAKNKLDANGRPVLNLASSSNGDSSTDVTKGFSKNLLSANHVGSVDFSEDGKTIYYTKLVALKTGSKLKIYTAKLNSESGDWVREEVLPFCDDRYNFAHPALALNGKTLYFSSDMKGTLGGMDIFKVKKNGKSWGRPKNLGKIVNTQATEIFPYVTPSGHLSFASNGHPGFGGLDAFWVINKNGVPDSVANALRPINSSYDDFAAVISPDDTLSGYLSSNRATEGMSDEIYAMELTEDYGAEIQGVNIDSIRQVALDDSLRLLAYEESMRQARMDEVADSVAKADALALTLALAAEQQQRNDDEMEQGEAFVIADPNLLFAPEEDGVIETFLVDALSSQLLKNATYTLVNNRSNKVLVSGSADRSANVILSLKSLELLKGQALTLVAQIEYGNFSSYTFELLSDRLKTYDDTHPVMLIPIMAKRDKVEENIIADETVTGGAPFAFDGAALTRAGEKYMNSWADFLNKNPDVRIKLMTHTDGRGDVAYNFTLSQQRAFEAKRYLIDQGVNHMQVIARGYGERYPLVDCNKCTEQDHDVNRRIEIEIINSKK